MVSVFFIRKEQGALDTIPATLSLHTFSMTHEILFWLLAGLLLLVVVAAVACSMVCAWAQKPAAATKDALLFLRSDMAQLELDLHQGTLSEAQYEESVQDLRRQALEAQRDLTAESSVRQGPARVSAVIAGLFIVVAGIALYAHEGAPRLINFYDQQPRGGMMDANGEISGPVHAVDTPELYEAYLKVAPEDERVLMLLARKYVQRQEWEKAAATYERAIALDDFAAHDVKSLIEYANCLMALKNPSALAKAKTVVQKVLAINPESFQGHQLMSILCLEMKQWKEALTHLEFLLREGNPNDPLFDKVQAAAQYCRDQISWGFGE